MLAQKQEKQHEGKKAGKEHVGEKVGKQPIGFWDKLLGF
jgi:hypothetical protein